MSGKNALRKVEPRKLDAPVHLFSYLQTEKHVENWRGRRVTLRTAKDMVCAGEAIEVTRKIKGEIRIFYRETQPLKPSRPSQTTLTKATSEAVSKRNEQQSASERAHTAKFDVWAVVDMALVNGEFVPATFRAPTIRPRMSEQDKKRAVSAIQTARGRDADGRNGAFHGKPRTQSVHFEEMSTAA